jgi:hypothetical protein
MIPRRLQPALASSLDEVPAVALLGPRQVGKTTLALEMAAMRPAVYLDLESRPIGRNSPNPSFTWRSMRTSS